MSAASDLIAELATCGVRVEVVGDKVRLTPPNRLTPDQRERLKALKLEVLAHLRTPAPRSDRHYLDIIASWVERTPEPEQWPFALSKVVVVPPVDGFKPGAVADVVFHFADAVAMRGTTVRLKPNGKFEIGYPDYITTAGKKVQGLKPLSVAHAEGFDACVIAALRAKGFSFAESDIGEGSFGLESAPAPECDSGELEAS